MKKDIFKKVLPLTVMVGIMSVASLSFGETLYKPANFKFTGQDLAANIDSSLLQSSASVLYCQSDISAHGEAITSRCYDKAKDDVLVRAVEGAVQKMTFTPAKADGIAIPVRMSYRVVMSATKSDLIPNLGSMQAQYGLDYIAPQERLDVFDWYEKYSSDSWANGEPFLGAGELSRVAARVTKEGKPESVRTIQAKRAYQRDAKIVSNALKRARFIPGFVGDKPTSMGYLAVVNYVEDQETLGSR